MKTPAAILVRLGAPLEIVELEIPRLQPGQVLVEIAYSGVCRTQVMERAGQRGPDPFLPHCLGHEGGGVVRELGPGVQKCAVDQPVILSWIKGTGANVAATQYDWDKTIVNAGGVTTFSRLTVVSENRLTPAPADLDFKAAALLGCAGATGLGSVWNTVSAKPGQSLAVFGVGGVGLCAVAAAAASGLAPIVAIDIHASRLQTAKLLGASVLIDASQADVLKEIELAVPQGLDFAIECSGQTDVMRLALKAVRPRGGAAVVVGNAPYGRRLEIDPHQLNQGKRLLGTWGGDTKPDRDFPRYAGMLKHGRLDLTPLMSSTYPLEKVNAALDDLENGSTARPLIRASDL